MLHLVPRYFFDNSFSIVKWDMMLTTKFGNFWQNFVLGHLKAFFLFIDTSFTKD